MNKTSGADFRGGVLSHEELQEADTAKRGKERSHDCIVLELEENQLGILDRALSGYAKALEASRDMGVISHETFCGKADRARAVQYLVWEAKEKFDTAKRHLQAAPPTAAGSEVTEG